VNVADAIALFLDEAAAERGLSRNTCAAYRRDLDRYARHLADRGVPDAESVRREDVTAFLQRERDVGGHFHI
jgi:integrase/recombinase XerD